MRSFMDELRSFNQQFEGGVNQQVRQVLKENAGRCINCRSPADFVEIENVLKLFFVPVWRWPGKDQLMHCKNCGLLFPPSFSLPSPDSQPPAITGTLRCQSCAREVDPDFRFCPFCGSPL